MIKHIQELVAIKSVTHQDLENKEKPFGNEVAKALDYVLKLCSSFGFRTKKVGNMLGFAEIGKGDQLMGILCHLDVVPAGNDWTYPPFGGEIHEGKLYGRGTTDDKGPTIAAIYAMKDILDKGVKLDKRIRIIFGLTEESGDWVDMDYYKKCEEIPTFGFTPDADFPVIYGEMGIAMVKLSMNKEIAGFETISGGEAPNMVADFAKCRVKGKEYEAHGISAHGSTPWDGENAISKLMAKVGKTEECGLCNFYNDKIGFDLHGERLGLSLKDEASGKLSLNVGKIGTEKNNVNMELDIRYPVTCHLEDVMSQLKNELMPYGIEVSLITHMKPVYMDENGPVISKLMEAYREVTGDDTEASVMGGGTYARAMDNIVAFGPMFPGRECTEHMKDEYVFIDDIKKARRIYELAIKKLATEV